MTTDIKVGDKYLCIRERGLLSEVINIVGKTYQIISIDNYTNINQIYVVVSNEKNNNYYYYTLVNDTTHYYFHEHFCMDIKEQRKNKLEKIQKINK